MCLGLVLLPLCRYPVIPVITFYASSPSDSCYDFRIVHLWRGCGLWLCCRGGVVLKGQRRGPETSVECGSRWKADCPDRSRCQTTCRDLPQRPGYELIIWFRCVDPGWELNLQDTGHRGPEFPWSHNSSSAFEDVRRNLTYNSHITVSDWTAGRLHLSQSHRLPKTLSASRLCSRIVW